MLTETWIYRIEDGWQSFVRYSGNHTVFLGCYRKRWVAHLVALVYGAWHRQIIDG